MGPLTMYDNDTMRIDVDVVYVEDELWGVSSGREEFGETRTNVKAEKAKMEYIERNINQR
jgi:hypothetical protein